MSGRACTLIPTLALTNSTCTFAQIIQYRLDYYLSNYKLAKGFLLLNGTFVTICIGAVILAATQGLEPSNALWDAWTYVADPGTQVRMGLPQTHERMNENHIHAES